MADLDQTKFQSLLRHMPQGYVEFKVLYDEAGEPVDYEFYEVNEAFERIMKAKREHFLGGRITDKLKDFEYSEREWIVQVARAVDSGEAITFEHFSRRNKAWYELSVFSERPGYVSTLFHDITPHVQENNALKQLVNVSHRFVTTGRELLMNQHFLDQIRGFTGAKAVTLNLMDDDGKTYSTVALSGMDELLERSLDVLGFHPVGKKWPMSPKRLKLLEAQSPIIFDDILPLVEGVLPRRLIKNILRIFDLGQVVLFKIEKDGVFYGDLTIVMQGNKQANRLGLVELYIVHILEQMTKADRQIGDAKESMFEGFATVDLECIMSLAKHEIFHLNVAWERVLGFPLEELENMDFTSLIHPDDVDKTSEAFALLEEGKDIFRFVNRYRTIDGDYRSIEWLSLIHI